MPTQLIDRIFDLLEYLGERGTATTDEIAKAIRVPRPTVYRIAADLEQRRYLRRDSASRALALGSRFLELVEAARHGYSVARAALPFMRTLTARTEETCHLVVQDGAHAIIIEVVESPRSVRVSYPHGSRIPLVRGASPKVILAHLPDAEREAVITSAYGNVARLRPDHQSHAGTDEHGSATGLAHLRAALHEIRHHGYAWTVGEVFADVAAVAVPVLIRGHPPAALSLNLPVSRFDRRRVPHMAAELQRTASVIVRGATEPTREAPADAWLAPHGAADEWGAGIRSNASTHGDSLEEPTA